MALLQQGTPGALICMDVKISTPNIAKGTEPSEIMKGARKLLNCVAYTESKMEKTNACSKINEKK